MSLPEAIGVDLGGTKMAVGVIDAARSQHYQSTEPSTELTEEELVETLARALGEAREARPDVAAAGLGIPCTIDRERGVAVTAVNLPITDLPIREMMRERLGLPVFIDNDANTAALAEHRFGAARGAENAVMLTIGTGIGGGLILGGQPYRGSTGAGAELGHIVIDYNGPKCQGACPNHGCAEVMASGTALGRDGRIAAELQPDSVLGKALADGVEFSGRLVVEAGQAGDAAATEVIANVGRNLGALLSSLANTFDPDVIVIGGGVIAAGELLLGPAREELAARALPPMNKAKVAAAELGPDAGMIGAATMALEELEAG
ncbi:MAG: ROK family protein [Solirubrobacterales bacterium]